MSAPVDGPDVADRVAVIGMAGRFPGAPDVDALWALSRAGGHGIVTTGVDSAGRVAAYGALADTDRFDAGRFGMADHEASLVDPQQRLLLEVVVHALDEAGVDAATDLTSVYASCTPFQGQNPETLASARYEWDLAHGADYAATRVAYRLGLRGEAVTVQTACSSSLVAVHLAVQSLLSGQSDLAVACGASVGQDQTGYMVEEGMIASPTGGCRPFDVAADGTVPGSGVGAVVLKRLEDAERDGDRVRAVILGSAINNDGGTKLGFMAPSPTGQAEAIATAHAVARVDAGTIGYVEAHGTATRLGDQVELEGLRRAFALDGRPSASTALGSLKANCGHLDRAAGVSGLIKAVLVLEHGEIPPMAGCTAPAPELGLAGAGFRLPTEVSPWPVGEVPRRAGVSAFGVGGTNAHVVLEQAPPLPEVGARPDDDDTEQLYAVSGHSQRAATELAAAVELLEGTPAAVAGALARRPAQAFRTWRVTGRPAARPVAAAADPLAVFVFPGQGETVVDGMPQLRAREPVFAAAVDECAALVSRFGGWDLLEELYGDLSVEERTMRFADMSHFQPALFAVQWGLARLWASWGVRPDVVLGHSVGEVAAAAVAGVLDVESAVRLVVARGDLMEQTEVGATLSVGVPAEQVRLQLSGGLELAADNGARLCTVTGPVDEVAALRTELEGRGVFCRVLNIRHSPHGATMRAVAPHLEKVAATLNLQPAEIPVLTNVTGTWAGHELASASYWSRQLCSQVRFREALDQVAALPQPVVLVAGPGGGFAGMVDHELADRVPGVVHAYRQAAHGRHEPRTQADWLDAAGHAWSLGLPVDLPAMCPDVAGAARPVLPPTPFDHDRRWPRDAVPNRLADPGPERYPDPGAWLLEPVWEPWPPSGATADAEVDVFWPFEETADALAGVVGWASTVPAGADRCLWLCLREGASAPYPGLARALAAVLGQEYPGVRANVVLLDSEVGLGEGLSAETEAALASLVGDPAANKVFQVDGSGVRRLRHRALWPAPRPRRLATGDVVVTGGLGRVGQALARGFADLLSLGSGVHLAGRRPAAEVAEEVEGLRAELAGRIEVTYHEVDVEDADQVAALLDDVRGGAGLAGVVHAAALVDRSAFGLLSETTGADLEALRTAKVGGAQALAAALRPDDDAFVLLCSSLSVELGGVGFGGYVAANAWLDDFARARHREGDTRWTSVEWDAWLPEGHRRSGALNDGYALDDADGAEVLRRVLTAVVPVVTVSTGDLDRRRLEVGRELSGETVPVATMSAADVPAVVREVLHDVLGAVPDDPDEDLRSRGVESLAILQIISRVRALLGVHLALGDAMRSLSTTGLIALAQAGAQTGPLTSSARLELSPVEEREEYPTTAIQRRWLDLLPGGYGGIDLVVDVRGPVSSSDLVSAVEATLRRHTALRTVFRRADGTWLQRLAEPPTVPLVDLTGSVGTAQQEELFALARRAHEEWFDPEQRPPFGVQVVTLGPDHHALVLHAHHVLIDGWSSSLFLRDVATLATSGDPGSAPLQYVDYAVAHDSYMRGTAVEVERRHWQESFRGAAGPTTLPGDAEPAADQPEDRGEVLLVPLDPDVIAALRRLAEQRGTTMFAFLMSAYVLLVRALSGSDDVVVGTTAAGRATPEAEEIVGVFVNPLPIRVQVDLEESLTGFVVRVNDVLVAFHEHGNYPLEDLVAHVDPFVGSGLNDTFSAYLLYQNYWRPDGFGLDFRAVAVPDLHHKLMRETEIVVVDDEGALVAEVWWRPSRFTRAWAEEAGRGFARLLAAFVEHLDGDWTVREILAAALPQGND